MNLRDKILADLQSAGNIDFEVLLLTSLLLERYRFGSVKDTDENVEKDLAKAPPSSDDITLIRERLTAFIQSSPPPLLLQQAITTLGRCGDQNVQQIIQPLLKKSLEQLLEINTVVYACMVALDECGAGIFSRKSFGLSEFDQNIADARRYLEKIQNTSDSQGIE